MQYLMVIVIGLGAAACLLALVSRRRRRDDETASVAGTAPAVDVVALGISGSGKTVFLASLFHELHVPLGGRPYFLGTDAVQRVALSGVLREVSDPARPWPPGTMIGQTRTFTFDCLTRIGDGWTPALRINYLDYPGELLERAQDEGLDALRDLESQVQRADAVLGMLDGRRLLQLLQGRPEGRTYLTAAVQPMLGIMATTRSPVYLLITKWDLVRDFGEPAGTDDNGRLELVRQSILGLAQLRGLVDMRDIVRLIPVSAVGPNFATLDPGTGQVGKRADGTLQPMNVEVPLAAVVPDLVKRFTARLDEQGRAGIDAQVRRMMRLNAAEWGSAVAQFLARPASAALHTALEMVVGRPYSQEMAGMLLDWLGRPYRAKGEQVSALRDEAQRHAAALAQARIELIEHFHKTMYLFEARFPASWMGSR